MGKPNNLSEAIRKVWCRINRQSSQQTFFYVICNYGTLFSDYVILKAQTE